MRETRRRNSRIEEEERLDRTIKETDGVVEETEPEEVEVGASTKEEQMLSKVSEVELAKLTQTHATK